MQKSFIYKNERYWMDIKWGGENYCVLLRNDAGGIISGYKTIPKECLDNIQNFKSFLINEMIGTESDLQQILNWNGNLDEL